MPDFPRGLNRRQVLLGSAAAATAMAGLDRLPAATFPWPRIAERIWDNHVHLTGPGTPEERAARLLKYADRMGIDKLILSLEAVRDRDPPPERFRKDNDGIMQANRVAPDRLFGFAYVNPKHVEESLKDLDRCLRDGPMLGVKLWVALECNDPRLDPIMRRLGELKAAMMQHVYFHAAGNPPGESTPAQLAELAARHPNVPMIASHTGNDWERGVRAIRATKNVYAGLAGFDPTAGVVEMAVRELGASRIIFGSDASGRSFASQLSKVYAADIPESDKRLILGGNIERVLGPMLAAKGVKL